MPLVSCIMPTMSGRESFVLQAVALFESQDYPRKELVIVRDDELTGKHAVGAKRNIACSRAKGDLILHWDDDDWYAPNRISRQVEQHMESDAVLSGYHHITFADDENRKAWLYTGSRLYAVGTSLCYWRSYWAANPFPDLRTGEDNAFLQRAGRVHSSDGRDVIVARIHAGNTQQRADALKVWQQVDYAALTRIGYSTK